jgi:hypothetical protein|tara:strand:+ start:68 stop:529 length:462 start_codon:yes stop_codon:yes gene_type:complete
MATTTATIDITSTDLLTNTLALSAPMHLYQHNTTDTGLDEINYHRANIPTGTNFDLIQDSAALSEDASYVYICLKNTDVTDYVIISINAEVIGRLYAGDWAFFPWDNDLTDTEDAGDQTGNDSSIEITAVTHEAVIEYALFHNGETLVTAADS